MTGAAEEIVVVATLRFRPGAIEAALAAFELAIPVTHADDEGCLLYALHRDRDDPDQIVFIERWASEAALAAHLDTPHVATLGASLRELLAEPPVTFKAQAVPVGDPGKGAV